MALARPPERSIASLRNKLDPQQLEAAIKMLAEAETIYLVGLRRSFPISSYMSYAFGKLGDQNMLIDAVGGLAAEDLSFATQTRLRPRHQLHALRQRNRKSGPTSS